MDYVNQTYWDNSYREYKFTPLPDSDPLKIWLKKYIPRGNGTCLEIGCFPGGILSCLGEQGYELHGIDLTPRVETELPQWLQDTGYQTGKFIRGDFVEHDFKSNRYDIVASFGFIEHFSEWRTILLKQTSLVRKGGFLIIETPNFRGIIQRVLHAWLDKVNYARHNLDSMRPNDWKKMAEEAGFEVIFCGYFGNFIFWADDEKRSWFKKLSINLLQSLTKRLLKYLPNCQAYSPFCGVICRKL